MLSALGALLDRTALRLGQAIVDATVMPRPEEAAALRAAAAAFLDPALQRKPGRFFDFAARPPVPRGERKACHRSSSGTRCARPTACTPRSRIPRACRENA